MPTRSRPITNGDRSNCSKWTDFNGNECEGLLHFPEDYDPSKPYPTIVYFYEVQTFLKYRYNTPSPSRSIINPVYCTSNDYIVFIPDIKYRDGFPAEKLLRCGSERNDGADRPRNRR